jgi:hypothetical protein
MCIPKIGEVDFSKCDLFQVNIEPGGKVSDQIIFFIIRGLLRKWLLGLLKNNKIGRKLFFFTMASFGY